MTEYISIPEAAAITGKSGSTIRRIVKRLSDGSQADVVKMEMTPQGVKYLVKRETLFKELSFQMEAEPDIQAESVETPVTPDGRYMEAILKQLEEKDKQISQLIERLREANIIVNTYQQRQLTMQDSTPVSEPIADEKKKDPAWIGWLLVGVLVALLGFATWINWRF